MELPEQIEFYFEQCPSAIFPTTDNAAESNENHIVFNEPWFTVADRWNNHPDDIEVFVFHELSHLYQLHEIKRLDNGLPLHERISTVETWAIMQSINRLYGRKTLIIIAHRLQTIEKCDIVYRV